jgi:hypothetical protein
MNETLQRTLCWTVALGASLTLTACQQETWLQESPAQVARDQAAADAANASTTTVASADDDADARAPEATTTTSTTTTLPRQAYAGFETMNVGNCFQVGRSDAAVLPVDCARPHHGEVTAVLNVAPRFPSAPPTDADYDRIRDIDCRQAFDAYVRQPSPAGLVSGQYVPTDAGWYIGDRTVLCSADTAQPGNDLTTSVRKASG